MSGLVSCIMPTRGRSAMAAMAVRCYESQTYRPRELIVMDDEQEPSFPSNPPLTVSCYERLPGRSTIGAKRNLAINRASGEISCHWDSDDWSAPERIADQVQRMVENRCQVTGYREMLFVDATGQWWLYVGGQKYALGTSLCYTRAFWRRHRFSDVMIGEDTSFVWQAVDSIAVVPAGAMMVARIHGDNTSEKPITSNRRQWRRIAPPDGVDGKFNKEWAHIA